MAAPPIGGIYCRSDNAFWEGEPRSGGGPAVGRGPVFLQPQGFHEFAAVFGSAFCLFFFFFLFSFWGAVLAYSRNDFRTHF
jgi:hypothetical protein